LFSEEMGEPFTILHSISHVQAGVHSMEVLLLRIQKDPSSDSDAKGSGYSVSLEWITVSNTAEQGEWGGALCLRPKWHPIFHILLITLGDDET
jgi:hypothetical protein